MCPQHFRSYIRMLKKSVTKNCSFLSFLSVFYSAEFLATFLFSAFLVLLLTPRTADAQLTQQDQLSTHARAFFPQGEPGSTGLGTGMRSELQYNMKVRSKEKPKLIGEAQEGFWEAEAGGRPTLPSQTQSTPASQSQSEVKVSPYVGYNSAVGYEIDLEQAVAIEYDPEDNDGSNIASGRGGFVAGVGANFALSERESFDLRLRPSVEMAFVSGQSESTEEYTLNTDQQYVQLSGDVIAQFDRGGQYTPYAGGGLAFVRLSGSGQVGGREMEEIEVSGTSVGVNLLGGIRLNDAVDFGIPYAQLRLTLVDPRTDTLTDLDAPSLTPAITLAGGVSLGL